MASPPAKAESLHDQIGLCFVVNGKKQNVKVVLGDKFSVIAFQLAVQLQWTNYDFKKVGLTYRKMTLRGYMMPYCFNMKDGDVIECSIPLYTAKELAEKAAAATNSLDATVTNHVANSTNSVTPPLSSTDTSSLAAPAALRNTINDDIDAAGTQNGNVATEETAHAMGINIYSGVMVRFADADQNITCMVARDGTVTMGEVFAAYARCKRICLTNCVFRLRGWEVYPNFSVGSVRLGPGACILCAKADRLITIRLLDNRGEETSIVTQMNVLIIKTLRTYAEPRGLQVHWMRCSFKGKQVGLDYTPETLRMKNNDKIDIEPYAFVPLKK